MRNAFARFVPCAIFLFLIANIRLAVGSESSVRGFEGTKANNTWRVCNKSSKPTIWVGLRYNIPNGFVHKGWYSVDRGTCRNVLTLDRSTTVFYFAEAGKSRWGGKFASVSFCRGTKYELIDRRVNGQWQADRDCPAGSTFGSATGDIINGFSVTLVD
jgi:uncharacterized membrane protein